eukprot:5391675-Amphidinium_carterae.1
MRFHKFEINPCNITRPISTATKFRKCAHQSADSYCCWDNRSTKAAAALKPSSQTSSMYFPNHQHSSMQLASSFVS